MPIDHGRGGSVERYGRTHGRIAPRPRGAGSLYAFEENRNEDESIYRDVRVPIGRRASMKFARNCFPRNLPTGSTSRWPTGPCPATVRRPSPCWDARSASLLATPFDELYATAGIGQKKIRSLVELLQRAVRPHPPGGAAHDAPTSSDVSSAATNGGIDPSLVSEALWVEWRASVQTHDLGKETMGRCARSLQDLPRVIWNTPLDAYTGLSLQAIRSLKTHGEKRVRAVLEVFGSMHAIVGRMNTPAHLAVRIMPQFVAQVEERIHALCRQTTPVTVEQIRRHFVDPLMAQVRIDLGDQIARLAESRLALDGSGATVRQVARRLNLTRARVYQLLNDVGAIMLVRWPEAPGLGAPTARAAREPTATTAASWNCSTTRPSCSLPTSAAKRSRLH